MPHPDVNVLSYTVMKGNTLPRVEDQIFDPDTNDPFPLSGWSVVFRMRPEDSDTLTVDASATIVSAPDGEVRYAWNSVDTQVPGIYKAWWRLVSGGLIWETKEFEVIIDEHSPGYANRTGAVAETVRGYIPETITAMTTDINANFNDKIFQRQIDIVKYRLFATVSTPQTEGTLYSPQVLDHVAKLVTLRMIPSGIDYWANQQWTRQMSGTNESETFPDRPRNLLNIRKMLKEDLETERLVSDEDGNWIISRGSLTSRPSVTNNHANVLTPDPWSNYPLYLTTPYDWL